MKSTLIRFGAIALVGAAAFIGAQATGAPPGGSGEFSFSITGKVLRGSTTVGGAAIRAYGAASQQQGGSLRGITANNGTFVLGGVQAGTYSVRASKTGFGTGTAIASVGQVVFRGSRNITIRLR